MLVRRPEGVAQSRAAPFEADHGRAHHCRLEVYGDEGRHQIEDEVEGVVQDGEIPLDLFEEGDVQEEDASDKEAPHDAGDQEAKKGKQKELLVLSDDAVGHLGQLPSAANATHAGSINWALIIVSTSPRQRWIETGTIQRRGMKGPLEPTTPSSSSLRSRVFAVLMETSRAWAIRDGLSASGPRAP